MRGSGSRLWPCVYLDVSPCWGENSWPGGIRPRLPEPCGIGASLGLTPEAVQGRPRPWVPMGTRALSSPLAGTTVAPVVLVPSPLGRAAPGRVWSC